MSWWKNLAKYAAPVVGAVGGSIGGGALGLSPALGGAIGGALGGFAGGEIGGSSLKGSLLEAGIGGVGGFLAGPTLADWAGTTPGAISAAAGSGIGGAAGGQSSSLTNMLNTIGQGSAQSASIPAQIASVGATPLANAAMGAASGGAPGIGGNLVSGVSDFFSKNPELIAGGVGAASLLAGAPGEYPAEGALEDQAQLLASRGTAGLNGQLTPSASLAFNDAVTTIKSSYANMGLAGSTMEAQDIEAAKQRAVSASVAEGMQELGISQNLYAGILGYHQQEDSELSSAISNLMGQVGYGLGGAHA